MTRDEAQRQAIRLYNELARIRKIAKQSPRYERPPLEARAKEIGAQIHELLDSHFEVPV